MSLLRNSRIKSLEYKNHSWVVLCYSNTSLLLPSLIQRIFAHYIFSAICTQYEAYYCANLFSLLNASCLLLAHLFEFNRKPKSPKLRMVAVRFKMVDKPKNQRSKIQNKKLDFWFPAVAH